MKPEIKKFIKKHIVNDKHPFLLLLFQNIRLKQQKYNHNLTYAEIEAKISQKYKAFFGRELNWDNPETYNEKLHVSKLYTPSPEKTKLADKLAVREWIAEKIGSEYSVPLLGVYDSFDEINFDALPDKFVIKCSHDCGSTMLVKDKKKLSMKLMKRKYDIFIKRNYAYAGFEMHYRDIEPKILIEKYLGASINDYKFTCFDGEPYCCRIDIDRFGDHRRNIYDMDWKILPFMKGPYQHPEKIYPRPKEYDLMKEIVRELSRGFDQVRTDLYLVDGHIYFGEMTFTNGNGFEEFIPDEWDYKLGKLWQFDNTVRKKVLAEKIRP